LRPAVKPQTACSLPVIATANKSSQAKQRRHKDPYALAQAAQRKAVNLQRRAELQKERDVTVGHPVRGITTPFIESFDNLSSEPIMNAKTDPTSASESEVAVTSSTSLNHFLTPEELEKSLQQSYILTQPLLATSRDSIDPAKEEEDFKRHAEGHERAAAAVARIVSLANGNSKDRTRANVVRCIEAFGRHNTDPVLQPRPMSVVPRAPGSTPLPEKTPRAGPDTGSSEVQIAILTAKIRVLANHLEAKGGNKDKVNKRNLRLLVHRRQKLLAYLRQKERGGDRWKNLIETLGLTEATWKGEISL
jgi:ribosomal protein S15